MNNELGNSILSTASDSSLLLGSFFGMPGAVIGCISGIALALYSYKINNK